VETTESDISSYIPTNLISITDGQVYLDTSRFERNQRPAVDIGKSVSRIGGAAQLGPMRSAARNLRITMSRFEALESLTRVGLDVDPATRKAVERGRILREILRQPRFTVRTVAGQVFALTAVAEGFLDGVPPTEAARAVWFTAQQLPVELSELVLELEAGRTPAGDWKGRMRSLLEPSLRRDGHEA
jgi:F-type H+/Na+-transporting ATPase subunit alpha